MALGGQRIRARPARTAFAVLATAVVAGLALPAGASADCNPTLPAEGVLTPADTCAVTAGFHVVTPSGTPVRVDPGGTLHVNAIPESSATLPAMLANFAWDWGTGTFGPDNPSSDGLHVFSARGVFNVRVRATDDATPANSQASGATPVTVAFPLTGDFSVAPTGQARQFNFTGTANEAGTGVSITYQWDFNGDGTPDTSPNASPTVSHTYPADGTYTAKLVISDDVGQSVVPVHTVGAFNQVPVLTVATVAPNPTVVGSPVTLNAAASDADGAVVNYLWDLDGNGSADAVTPAGPGGASYTVSYPNPGTIPVRVGAQDNSGGVAWRTLVLTVGLPGGGNGTLDGGGALGPGSPGTATGPGSPGTATGPAASGSRFTASLGGSSVQKLKAVRKRGVAFTCTASRAASCSVTVWLAAKDARALRVNRKTKRPVVVAALRTDVKAGGSASLTLKPAGKLKRALARTRKLSLTLQGVASEKGSARRVSLARVISLRR
jgi:PKD domain